MPSAMPRAASRRPRIARPPSRRALSQVHIAGEETLAALAARFAPAPDDCVLEVGPGTGNLTDYVAPRVRRYVAVEADRAFASALAARYAPQGNVKVAHGSILDFDAEREFADEREGSVRVLTNLPYHISGAFLGWLLDRRRLFRDALVMLQREVAQKILRDAPEHRGALFHRVRFAAEVSSAMKLPPSAFTPRPKVASEVIRFVFRREPLVRVEDEAFLFALVERAFAERRKTIRNNLRGWKGVEEKTLDAAFSSTGLKETARAEELTLEDFARMSAALGAPRKSDRFTS